MTLELFFKCFDLFACLNSDYLNTILVQYSNGRSNVMYVTSFSSFTEENTQNIEKKIEIVKFEGEVLTSIRLRNLLTPKENKQFNSHQPSVFLLGEQDWVKEVSTLKYCLYPTHNIEQT